MNVKRTAVAVVLALLIAACGDSGSGDGANGGVAQRGGEAVVLIHEPTAQHLNKLITIAQGTFWITGQIYESLTFIDETGATVPQLAETWEVSSDDLTWTFKIREGVTFSDGSEMDANDVAFSLRDSLRPENPIGLLVAAVDSIDVADAATVEIRLQYPYPALPEALAGFNFAIIPEDWGGMSEEEFYEAPFGTGPFQLSEGSEDWVPGTEIRLVRNPNYWLQDRPYLDSVVFRTVNVEDQRVLQLRGGQAHLIFGPDVSQPALDLQQTDGVTVFTLPTYRTMFIGLGQGFEPLQDVHVRRAIAHAVDRQALKSALLDFPIVSGSYIPTELSVHDPDAGLPFDLDLARGELAQSAYPDGVEISILIDAGSPQENTLAQVLQQQLSEIGITLQIQRLDLGARIDRLVTSDFEIIVQDINQVTADPAEMTAWAIDPSFGAYFFTGYDDPSLAELAREAARAADPGDRERLYSQAQQAAADAAYIIVPYNLPNVWSARAGLMDIRLGLADTVDLSRAYFGG